MCITKMFKLQDCFLASGVFNEALLKRFKESYDPKNGSRLWMIPGHVVYTTPDLKVFTCDARPLDLLSPSEPCTGELISTIVPVLQIFFETETQAPRMYIALSNGDVQIFEYRALLYEWARVGYFNVNIVSPNSVNSHHSTVTSVLISPRQNTIYWAEEVDKGEMTISVHKRSLPAYSVREITQSTLGPPQALLKNCPSFDIVNVQENICIIPHLPNSVNLYIILSARCHLWLFDISGKCMWRGIIEDQPLDFITLCMKSVDLWTNKGKIKVCTVLNSKRKEVYILHDDALLSVTVNGEVNEKTKLPFTVDLSLEYYILWNMLYVFKKNSLEIYSVLNGQQCQVLSLLDYGLVHGTWSLSASLPCLGVYTDTTIFMLQPQSLLSIFDPKTTIYLKVLHLLSQENVHLFAIMKDIVNSEKGSLYFEPLQNIPSCFQSKALLLALLQLCREKGIDTAEFPFHAAELEVVFDPDEMSGPDTRLKELLEPLVECYCKLERAKSKFKTSI